MNRRGFFGNLLKGAAAVAAAPIAVKLAEAQKLSEAGAPSPIAVDVPEGEPYSGKRDPVTQPMEAGAIITAPYTHRAFPGWMSSSASTSPWHVASTSVAASYGANEHSTRLFDWYSS